MSEPMEFDAFENLWEQPDPEPVSKLPPDGTHLFTVKGCTWFEDSGKLSLFLTTADGSAISKKCYLRQPEKAKANKEWLRCLFDEPPTGSFDECEWSACEGKTISAQVGRFTPADREDEITFVNRPMRPGPAEGPAEEAVVKRPKATRTAKVDRETQANRADVPF